LAQNGFVFDRVREGSAIKVEENIDTTTLEFDDKDRKDMIRLCSFNKRFSKFEVTFKKGCGISIYDFTNINIQ